MDLLKLQHNSRAQQRQDHRQKDQSVGDTQYDQPQETVKDCANSIDGDSTYLQKAQQAHIQDGDDGSHKEHRTPVRNKQQGNNGYWADSQNGTQNQFGWWIRVKLPNIIQLVKGKELPIVRRIHSGVDGSRFGNDALILQGIYLGDDTALVDILHSHARSGNSDVSSHIADIIAFDP